MFERDAKPSGDFHRMVTVKVGQFEESLELGDAELRVPVALRPHMEVDEGNFESPARLVCMITQCSTFILDQGVLQHCRMVILVVSLQPKKTSFGDDVLVYSNIIST